MEWWILGAPFALMALFCPLMMVGMVVGGWLFARGRSGAGSHGPMMCHGGHGRSEGDELVAEMKAQRERLDRLIARAEAAADKPLAGEEAGSSQEG